MRRLQLLPRRQSLRSKPETHPPPTGTVPPTILVPLLRLLPSPALLNPSTTMVHLLPLLGALAAMTKLQDQSHLLDKHLWDSSCKPTPLEDCDPLCPNLEGTRIFKALLSTLLIIKMLTCRCYRPMLATGLGQAWYVLEPFSLSDQNRLLLRLVFRSVNHTSIPFYAFGLH